MTRQEAIFEAKHCLELYLNQKGINTSKQFHCLHPAHTDKKPSMGLLKDKTACGCLSCGAHMDIFDLVGIDYGLTTFNEQLQQICELFNIDFDVSQKTKKKFNPKNKIIPISDKELELIGLRWKSSSKNGYMVNNSSVSKPADYDKRMPIPPDDAYLEGEIMNFGQLWFDFQRNNKEVYEEMIRNKCREKSSIIIDCVKRIDAQMQKDKNNAFLEELRQEFFQMHKEVMDIYKRFHGKVKKVG